MMEEVTKKVQEVYGAIARAVNQRPEKASCCCGSSCCSPAADPAAKDVISTDLYSDSELAGLPLDAFLASLGCGNPTALAQLNAGEVVVDLGSGGGIDVLLSAKRVGPTGFAYGLDMTDDMLALAEKNKAAAGVSNVKFLKGNIESIPLPDASVDVIISNCVINLSVDKDRVLAEAFRVLRPGGRFAVSDIVIDGELPEVFKRDLLAWSGCVSGALSRSDYETKLRNAGFHNVEITATRVYNIDDIVSLGFEAGNQLSEADKAALDRKLMSAFIHAVK